jgi:hypothetical protein
MKSELFLLLPVGATVFNILFALQLNHAHSKVDAQPVVNEACIDRCAGNILGECYLSLDDYRKDDAELFEHDLVDPEQDPVLNFKGQAGKFINMSPDRVSLYWDGPSEPLFHSDLGPWESGGTDCYPSHKFLITKPHHPEDVICRFYIVKGTSVYYCDPFSEESRTQDTLARGVVTPGKLRSLDELSHHDLDDYAAHVHVIPRSIIFGEPISLDSNMWYKRKSRNSLRCHRNCTVLAADRVPRARNTKSYSHSSVGCTASL